MGFDLNHNEDQRQILDSAAAMLDASYPVSRRRETAQDDIAEIAGFGTFSLALPEDDGGAGFSIVEEVLLHVLFGRHVVSTRALASALGARLASDCGRDDLAEQLRTGEVTAAAALRSGETLLVADAHDSGLAVIFDKQQLTLVETQTPSGEIVDGLGHATPLRRIAHNGYSEIGRSGDPHLPAIASLLACAQLVGIAEAARDLAVSYAEVRQQFGRPIGAFQAIKHHCANMAINAEMLSSQLDMAALALRDEREDAAFQIEALGRLAPKAALANARKCIQIHGGIGFSAEADAHHFLKQAHLLTRLLGSTDILKMEAPLAPYKTQHGGD